MQEHCRRLDAASEVGYLETDKPENVRFYERFRYEVIGEEPVIGGFYVDRGLGSDRFDQLVTDLWACEFVELPAFDARQTLPDGPPTKTKDPDFRAFREVAGARFVSRYHRPRIREIVRHTH